ncbi:MAG: hypothetical protein JMDDDDMK_05163 [Acidobacteria bacterium]|nr:hypothetical protein [Acidobacteriota bacterium]
MAKKQPNVDRPAQSKGARKGEEQVSRGRREPGRHRDSGAGAGRPAGKSTPRDVTSINPEDRKPVDPESPYLIPA